MFLIPLGLRSRLIRWPIATFLILVATCVVSISYFSKNTLYIRHVRQAMQESKILEARKNLLLVVCHQQHSDESCEFLKTHLKAEDLFDSSRFLKAYRKEFPNAKSSELRKLTAWLADDRIDRRLRNSEFEKAPALQAYVQARAAYLQISLLQSKKDLTFMRGNGTILASLKAMFTHEGWIHLVGNMLIFAVFAVYLEQRIGLLGLAVLYLLGGLASNFLQLPFLPMGVRLFGASGAVSAVIGAFSVYFWREKMRCWLSVAFVFNRLILMPAWLYIGLFLLLSDLVGVLGVGSESGSGVAHLAHLSGFAVGFIFAYMQMDLFPLKKSFLFKQEQDLYYDAKKSGLLEEKMVYFRKIYSLNRESFYAFRGLFIYLSKQNFQMANFSKEDRAFVGEIIFACITYQESDEKRELTREILRLVPLNWNLADLELKVGPGELVDTADKFTAEGDLVQTLRYYDLFFMRFAGHPKSQDIQSAILNIFDQFERFETLTKGHVLGLLLTYAEHHPENHFHMQIRQLIHQVQKEEEAHAAG